ncbi:MAG: zinc metallopeptidase [Chloroflexota bacterium]
MWFDPLYLLFSLPALLLGFWAQWKVQAAFNRYSQERLRSGLTGAEVARRVLAFNGLHQVQVEPVQGFLSDHYDPGAKVLRLSPNVYHGVSAASAGVAAHEAGHAIQDAQGYRALQLRSLMVPAVNIGSWLGPIVFIIGILMLPVAGAGLAWTGVLLFAGVAAFALVTLPVEFDASRRAKYSLAAQGIALPSEMEGVNRTLDAAALTYVAGAISAISTLLYYVFLLTGMRSEE